MKKLLASLLFLACLSLPACEDKGLRQNEEISKTDTVTVKIDYEKIKKDSIEYAQKQLSISKLVDDAFYKSLQQLDVEYGEGQFYRFTSAFQRLGKKPYDFYLEYTILMGNAKAKAESEGTEYGARGKRILHNYYSVLKEAKDSAETILMSKYGFDYRMITVFRNNYCSCYSNYAESFCKDDKCLLDNSTYLKE